MDIEDYDPRGTEVLDIDGSRAVVFFDNDLPKIGEAVRFRPSKSEDSSDGSPLYGWVQSHDGNQRVTVGLTGDVGRLEVGDDAESTAQPAALPLPEGDVFDLAEVGVEPTGTATFALDLEAPAFEELDGARPPALVDHGSIDRAAPMSARGLNLVVDASVPPYGDPGSFWNLAGRLAPVVSADTSIWVAESPETSAPRWVDTVIRPAPGDFGRILALRAGVCLAADHRNNGRDVLLVAELPAPRSSHGDPDRKRSAVSLSMGDLVDQLASTASSTQDAAVTTLFRLPVGQTRGLDSIVETLDIGGTDTQIRLDDQGRVRPRRCSSRADLDAEAREQQQKVLKTLHRAEQARDKRQIWGEVELSEAERGAIEAAQVLVAPVPPSE